MLALLQKERTDPIPSQHHYVPAPLAFVRLGSRRKSDTSETRSRASRGAACAALVDSYPKVPRAHPHKVVAKLGWQYTIDQPPEEDKAEAMDWPTEWDIE